MEKWIYGDYCVPPTRQLRPSILHRDGIEKGWFLEA
jgi:hypothetical protein